MSALRVWAPSVSRIRVRADGQDADLQAADDGWWTGPDLAPGTDYGFLLDDDETVIPDPASRRQPEGVHGPSRMYDQDAYDWRDAEWVGRDLTAAVVYELHIGTFTPGATFDAAIERLEHLARLGVTHVEVLPINAVNGIWNWGYDGVGWYAVHEPLGGPDGFKRFVDAAHGHGLAVVLDVVYNHLGPSGNYLPKFGPYLKPGRNTWGDLVNVEEPAVRRFIVDNALMWLRDFHLDALRLDAVHALQDSSPIHILAQLSGEVDDLAAELGRPLTLIAESDLNDPIMITPREQGGRGIAAQWDDDVHHALHSLLSGETQGYYCDFGSLPVLEKVFTRAFLHDGTYSTFRGHDHGAPVDRDTVRGWQFVVCLQNHDQVGNRAVGDRLPEIASPGRVRIGAVLLLTSPFTPMLWMGEEWAASTRWPFFTSHPEPELARLTGEGRVAEFAGHGWDVSQMIDPQDPAAYREAVLDWAEVDGDDHAAVLDLYRSLIRLRADEADLRDGDLRAVSLDYDEDAQWLVVHRGAFRVAVNLAATEQAVPVAAKQLVLATGPARPEADHVVLGPETAAVLRT
ncbi:malto-oligosyltrehalose trehalohydrolase [Jatrophihabitans endophyticus]|uniref:malto-oligosyltrehalose trehalohydrolase n=1 Tax=Jatrophihabitans endophyticus TaxID=1206085 RepID=UPI000933EEF1|nr:malto-oligosyltrehalose trehalohydrolase [Jatrophihabitans endophyticus]